MEISRRECLRKGAIAAGALGLEFIMAEPLFAGELEDYRKKMFGGWLSKGLISYLTPDLYKKSSTRFEEILIEAENFFSNKTIDVYKKRRSLNQYDEDEEVVLDSLVRNLSLNGNSLLASIKTSERIRQFLKRHGKMDFPRVIGQLYGSKEKVKEKIASIDTLLPRATRENRADLQKQKQAHHQVYVGLQDLVYVCRDNMFFLRWHYPTDLENIKVDFKKARDILFEAGKELGQIDRCLRKSNYAGVTDHLQKYREKIKEGQNLFQKDINVLLKQAETNIGQNILGQPLTKIEYQGRLFYATKEFARDWEKVQKLIKKK
jgi:hypothetical protein